MTDRVLHTTAFVTLFVEYWLEQVMAEPSVIEPTTMLSECSNDELLPDPHTHTHTHTPVKYVCYIGMSLKFNSSDNQ